MPKKDETVERLRAELAANRTKLAAATSEVFEAVKPANLARSGAEQVKEFAKAEVDAAFGQFRNPDGSWKLNRLLMVGGAVVGAVVLAVTVSSVANRRAALTHQARKELTR